MQKFAGHFKGQDLFVVEQRWNDEHLHFLWHLTGSGYSRIAIQHNVYKVDSSIEAYLWGRIYVNHLMQ